LWKLGADLGWLSLEVPQRLGGAEASFAECAVVLEELGRHVAVGPFLGHMVGVRALTCNGSSDLENQEALLDGRLRGPTLPCDVGPDGLLVPNLRVERSGTKSGDVRVSGDVAVAPDLGDVDTVVVTALDGWGGLVIGAVALSSAEHVERHALEPID